MNQRNSHFWTLAISLVVATSVAPTAELFDNDLIR